MSDTSLLVALAVAEIVYAVYLLWPSKNMLRDVELITLVKDEMDTAKVDMIKAIKMVRSRTKCSLKACKTSIYNYLGL